MTPTVPVFSALWQFATSTVMADPGVRHFRVNTGNGQLAISTTDDDAVDRHDALVALLVDDRIAIRSTQTGGDWYLFRLTAVPVDMTTWVRADVALVDTGSLAAPPGGNDRMLFDMARVVTPADLPGWVTVDEVVDALGQPVSDPEHLQRCVDAANRFGFRRRYQAGYVDLPDVSPGPDASMGVIFYAVTLYRERGSVDSFASFDAYQTGSVPSSTMGQILRLLGVPRPAFDRLVTA